MAANKPATMKAIRFHEYGGPEVLVYEDAPKPVPGPGELLVQVYAASVNPVDLMIRSGMLKEMIPHMLPLIPGWDVSGVVEAVGPDTPTYVVGDEVFGRCEITGNGSFAEYAIAKPAALAIRPRFLDHTRAAAVPLAALTAWQAISLDRYERSLRLASGQTIVIRGAAGGVGSFAVQFAKLRGARVAAVVLPEQAKFARELGADIVIEEGRLRAKDVVKGADAVLDLVGGPGLDELWDVLKPGSSLASTVAPITYEDGRKRGMHAIAVRAQPNGEHLAEIARLIDDRKVRVAVSEVIPLAEARRAHELLALGKTRGKIVIQVTE